MREFDGGEHKMRPLVEVRNQDVYVVQSLCGDANASANDKLCRLLFFAGALKDAGVERVTAVTPYLAYARKDRRTQPRDPVTTRYVAALMEAVDIDRVVTLDIHNEAAFDNAFRRETVRLEAAEVFAADIVKDVANEPVVVMSPAAFLPAAMQLFESRAADSVLVTDSIVLRPEFTQWLAAGLRICSIAPLVARTIQDLAGH